VLNLAFECVSEPSPQFPGALRRQDEYHATQQQTEAGQEAEKPEEAGPAEEDKAEAAHDVADVQCTGLCAAGVAET
jgi:hypothetical protein